MYIGYFDEFGHNGAYISRNDPSYKTHPVFGIGGFIIPAHNVRQLSGTFRHIKETGLKAEIDAKVTAKGKRIEEWEKKGAALLTTQNVQRYTEVRWMINRLLRKLEDLDAKIVFYGQEKPRGSNDATGENESSRYDHAMKQLIQRVNWSLPEQERHILILDKQGPRSEWKFSRLAQPLCSPIKMLTSSSNHRWRWKATSTKQCSAPTGSVHFSDVSPVSNMTPTSKNPSGL